MLLEGIQEYIPLCLFQVVLDGLRHRFLILLFDCRQYGLMPLYGPEHVISYIDTLHAVPAPCGACRVWASSRSRLLPLKPAMIS